MSDVADDRPGLPGSASRWPGIDPEGAIRDDFDARILAVLWAVRKAFLPMLWLGLLIAISYFLIIGDPAAFSERVEALTSPGDLVRELLSPFTVVVAALLTRILVAFAALAAAYPLTRVNGPDDYPDANRVSRYWRMWWDRLQMSRAYRAERWTWTVRGQVLHRLNAWGTIWH